jgi:hypothetical protein
VLVVILITHLFILVLLTLLEEAMLVMAVVTEGLEKNVVVVEQEVIQVTAVMVEMV